MSVYHRQGCYTIGAIPVLVCFSTQSNTSAPDFKLISDLPVALHNLLSGSRANRCKCILLVAQQWALPTLDQLLKAEPFSKQSHDVAIAAFWGGANTKINLPFSSHATMFFYFKKYLLAVELFSSMICWQLACSADSIWAHSKLKLALGWLLLVIRRYSVWVNLVRNQLTNRSPSEEMCNQVVESCDWS